MADVTECGVTADERLWRQIGAVVFAGARGPYVGRWEHWASDREILIAAAVARGLSGGAALAWVEGEVRRRREHADQVGAARELARSIGELAKAMGEESAEALVARMPAHLRPYVAKVAEQLRG